MADEVRMSPEVAARVKDDFNNLSNEFANAQTAIFTMAGSMRSGCGEFSGGVEHGSGVFELGRRDLMEVGTTSAGLIAGNTEAAERRAEHGEKWTDEQMHQNLAWIIYLQENGAPESYTDWLNDPEAQQSVSASDPLAAAAQYETWIADPDHQDLETLQRLRELRRLIDDARDP